MKKLKMVLYGEPGVGKSVFACKSPNPFFITTDGNYEWLEDFGAKEEDHIQVNSWSEAKSIFTKLADKEFDKYETIVIDLLEDLFKWCEYEYCKRNKMEHVSDVGYGKGYDITRTEFFIEMCKLIGLDKNIIFIMHGISSVVKDRRGVEHTKYGPTDRIPAKLIDMLEGRVRYFLRCYLKAETLEDGTILKKRYLSLIPKENEFGIHRGVDESITPADIELDFNAFAECIRLNSKIDKIINKEDPDNKMKQKRSYTKHKSSEEIIENVVDSNKDIVDINSIPIEPISDIEEKTEENKTEQKELTQQEKIELIKAKLAAVKNK